MNEIEEWIHQYDQIVILRHIHPDLDAFGSQFGLYWTLKQLFPYKNILLEGDMDSSLMKLYPSFDQGKQTEISTLGIVLDTANRERIDGDISGCDKIIKIDHHIVVDSYGDINIEIADASSCSEIVVLLLKKAGIKIPLIAAEALYLGIVGDSNRFLYKSTSLKTFEAASYLLEMGIDIENLYQKLYLKPKKEIDILQFIYSHYQSDDRIVWYYLSTEDLIQLGISREEGSNYVNSLANIEEFLVWMAITQNDKDHNYRVSIRSRGVAINEVASMFRGGGHQNASGATLLSLDELDQLIIMLKEKINEETI